MQRRHVLKLATLAAAAGSSRSRLFASAAPDTTPVKRVLIVFKCHLDVGFTQTQAQVMRKYFDEYYPAAMARAAEMRAAGSDRYIWTTGSWLLYEYLDQATPAQRKAMEAAIHAGDITWHALPFSWQTEMLDRSMIAGALGLSADLDARFGRKTIGAKMTDVPGHTRGIIAPLQAAGVRMLDIGINAASVPPDVPDAFLWRDEGGHSLAMIYHRHDYGSVIQIPGSDLAVAVEVRNDNSGPHTIEEIKAIYAKLRAQFPGASVEASTLSDVATAMEPFRAQLPVFTGEIGDTWIYGIPSDPAKVARFREVARLRQQWIKERHFDVGDSTDRQLLRRLLLAVEHTWGTDTKSYLDNDHYRPADLAAVIDQPAYKTMTTSWQEKRDDIDLGIAALPADLREQAAARLKEIAVSVPASDGLKPLELTNKIEAKHFTLQIDPESGAITSLVAHGAKHDWASTEAPMALLTYQTLSAAEFADYLDRYVQIKADWAPRDFGKPNIEHFNAVSQEWHPKLVGSFSSHDRDGVRIVLHMQIADDKATALGSVAWPAEFYMELTLPDREPTIDVRLTTINKAANRMPEALWFTFNLPADQPLQCCLNKVGEDVSSSDVVSGGGRAMHAVNGPIRLRQGSGQSLEITSHDAPVVALGTRSPLNFSRQLPSLRQGVHVCLFNNAWGTNYPQWASGDWLYRFTLRANA
ncbi:hypothetical protein HDF16_003135 [Granulicella aggregans]|uniref:Glycosyl hydrolase family 38 n=1 Tax=Granulicella aggregans TaxID=474949 RepID=A0A7W7ZFM2_9BACT|nr:DUF5054 domain-containing protein [Granulicella aggregans]MBB5058421.1 hypothetical protein [Granulicella aggregans]